MAKPEEKNPLGSPQRSDIKRNIKGIGWVNLTHDEEKGHVLLNTLLNLRVL